MSFVASRDLYSKTFQEKILWQSNEKDPVWSSPFAKKGGKITIPIVDYPPTFRIFGPSSNGYFQKNILNNYMHLVYPHPLTGNPMAGIAKKWFLSKDTKRVYFYIDPDARWSTGKSVTSMDYKNSILLMSSDKIKSKWQKNYIRSTFKKIVVIDRNVFYLEMKNQNINNLWIASDLIAIPRDKKVVLGENYLTKENYSIWPNNGPYVLSEFKKNKFIRFKRNKNWWAKDKKYFLNRFNVDVIEYKVSNSIARAKVMFQKNNIDVLVPPYSGSLKNIGFVDKKGYSYKIWLKNRGLLPITGIWLNTESQELKSTSLRRAIAYGFNLDSILPKILDPSLARLKSPFQGNRKYSHSGISPYKFNPKLAREILRKDGFALNKDGFFKKNNRLLTLSLVYEPSIHQVSLSLLQKQMKKIGIKLKLISLKTSKAATLMQKGTFHMIWASLTNTRIPHFKSFFHSKAVKNSGGVNLSRVKNKNLDRLIESYESSKDLAFSVSTAKKIQERIFKLYLFIPGFYHDYLKGHFYRWIHFPESIATPISENLLDEIGISPNMGGIASGGGFWIEESEKQKTIKSMTRRESLTPITFFLSTSDISQKPVK